MRKISIVITVVFSLLLSAFFYGGDVVADEVTQNLVTGFKLEFSDNDGNVQEINTPEHVIDDLEAINYMKINYELTIPDGLVLQDGDTYKLPLPAFFGGSATGVDIKIDGVTIAKYSIIDNEIIITFNDEIETLDNRIFNVNLTGSFESEVFITEEEIEINVPLKDGTSFETTVRIEREAYDGEDRKEASAPYIIVDGAKVYDAQNPTHADWTVIVNDDMETYESAKVVDSLHENLAIDLSSVKVFRIIRNYKNEEIGREEVTDIIPTLTSTGFEVDLGAISDAYEITYTTTIDRPDGGGTQEINNSALIELDENEQTVEDNFHGNWSHDLPVIEKTGQLSTTRDDIIN